MKKLNRILSFLGFRTNNNKGSAVSVSSNVEVKPKSNVAQLCTIYRIGPSYLTYQHPIDTNPFKEIYNEDGLIGPGKYSQEVLEHIKDYDNMWFFDHEDETAMLMDDLNHLAIKHKIYGAYSLMGSLESNCNRQMNLWKIGASLGCRECMVCYGISLYRNGNLDEGFRWLKKGADSGDVLGMFLTGLSYNFGTLSEMNYDKAAEYYLKAIKADKEEYLPYVNLGALLVDSGYYHTALKYFQSATLGIMGKFEEYNENRNAEDLMSNTATCMYLLRYPYEVRSSMLVLQSHSTQLDNIFCNDKDTLCKTNELNFKPAKKWIPKEGQLEIDIRDLDERKNAIPKAQIEVDEHEDFKFPAYRVHVNETILYGGVSELVFIEKYCHIELNNYLKENLIRLRAMFREIGYSLTYLPAHSYDFNNGNDVLFAYIMEQRDVGPNVRNREKTIGINDFWNGIIECDQLPDDCAGFLRCLPNEPFEIKQKAFEFIQFPTRPGTDWNRAFTALFDFLKHKETPKDIKNKQPISKHILPEGSYLLIDEDYEISLRNKDGGLISKINLTPLPKVMLLALLNHPEGLVIKNLSDIKDELFAYYRAIVKDGANIKNIDTLVDPTDNSANEKISRIRAAFKNAMETYYKDDLPQFLPQGRRGEAYSILWSRERVRYE